jgi:hypothetical protein
VLPDPNPIGERAKWLSFLLLYFLAVERPRFIAGINQFRHASYCYQRQFRHWMDTALMINWTLDAEGIAQKPDLAKEMHPQQNEIHRARGPHETSSPRPSNVISSSDAEHVFPLVQIKEQIAIKRGSGGLALLLLFLVAPSLVQSASLSPPPQKSDSLGDSLRHSEGKEIHIFYIHGIGSDGPNDYDSLALRSSICTYLRDCTSPAGTPIGEWDYADQDQFRPDATVPEFKYMDELVWKNADEWRAAAPYAIHFQIARANGQNLYVDELNWWPLTFSLKCRQIIASDASFVAPSKARIETCSRREPNLAVPQRFKSYDWITPEEAARMAHLRPKGARANRALKTGLIDWGFSDAVLALGPLRLYVLDGIRQLILKSQGDSTTAGVSDRTRQPFDPEYIIVGHSLGSYLIFSALDINQTTTKTTTVQQSANRFDQILERTSMVFFLANQLRLLELASLDGPSERNFATHLESWGHLRCDYLKSKPGASQGCRLPRITALNDPSDLLTWTVPNLPGVEVENYTVKNSTRWFWIIENPTKAHNNYARHKRAIREMLQSHSEANK